MPIKVGDTIPSSRFRVLGPEGPAWKTTDEVFKGKKVALFAVPGAFTGVCSNQHMPSVIDNAAALKAKGVDTVAITAVNDHMVMNAWKNTAGEKGKAIDFLADGGNEFAKAVDLNVDLTQAGMGVRSKRYSMLVEDGVVKKLNVEEPGKYEVSGGDVMLKQL
jgi:glutaredoxin/glutathione-dependent peroxiredoxin